MRPELTMFAIFAMFRTGFSKDQFDNDRRVMPGMRGQVNL